MSSNYDNDQSTSALTELQDSGLVDGAFLSALDRERGDTLSVIVDPETSLVDQIPSGSDVVWIQGGGDFSLDGLSRSVIRDMNALIFSTQTNVTLDLSSLFRGSVIFGAGDDFLTYSGRIAQNVQGGDGNDSVIGGTGSDTVKGGAGEDSVVSGNGKDIIDAGDGDDTVDSGTGNDSILCGAGNDSITAGTGNDTIVTGLGDDTIVSGTGKDSIIGSSGNNYLDGGSGNDKITGGGGNDVLIGGDGNDSIISGTGNDTIFGGAGTDTITVGDGSDIVDAGTGNDKIVVQSSEINDDSTTITIDGGAGRDVLDLFGVHITSGSVDTAANTATVVLADGTTLDISNVERFIGNFDSDAHAENISLTGLGNFLDSL
ncbi:MULTISPECIES: calcium-binding protein [Methylomonas]|uniref:Calcium-binding protein n=1 Tax=Methylomonas koyamae TaxID=702114 RepID=A0A177N1P2_9GAMM|nr:calcium-binding protein [Methylomonas koyamae]OAI11574.1 hypothetical protein A1355_15875 [Methylomonas koyamae]